MSRYAKTGDTQYFDHRFRRLYRRFHGIADIADYVASNIQDPLSRVNGVGDIDAYIPQYFMRIWLDPAT